MAKPKYPMMLTKTGDRWTVWADRDMIRQLLEVEGTSDQVGHASSNCAYFKIDPRYDENEVIEEIKALGGFYRTPESEEPTFHEPVLRDYIVEIDEIVTVRVQVKAENRGNAKNIAMDLYNPAPWFDRDFSLHPIKLERGEIWSMKSNANANHYAVLPAEEQNDSEYEDWSHYDEDGRRMDDDCMEELDDE